MVCYLICSGNKNTSCHVIWLAFGLLSFKTIYYLGILLIAIAFLQGHPLHLFIVPYWTLFSEYKNQQKRYLTAAWSCVRDSGLGTLSHRRPFHLPALQTAPGMPKSRQAQQSATLPGFSWRANQVTFIPASSQPPTVYSWLESESRWWSSVSPPQLAGGTDARRAELANNMPFLPHPFLSALKQDFTCQACQYCPPPSHTFL